MPDIVTHLLFSFKVIEELKMKDVVENKDFITLGSQGPDYFAYYNYLPWKKINKYNELSSIMHTTKTSEFLTNLINELKINYSREFHYFVLGFISHFAMDVHTHPYIIYSTGVYDKEDSKTTKARGKHLKFERGLDALYLKSIGLNPNKINLQKHFFTFKEIPNNFIEVLNRVFEKTYNYKEAGSAYRDAYVDFRSVLKVIAYDPYGIKKIIYRFFDLFTGKSSIVYQNLSYHNTIIKDVNYMNLEKEDFFHPCDKDEISNKSFPELVSDALEFAVSLSKKIQQYLDNKIEIAGVIPNISYETGKILNNNNELKYFNIKF